MPAHCTKRVQFELKDEYPVDLFLVEKTAQKQDTVIVKRPNIVWTWLNEIRDRGVIDFFFGQKDWRSGFWRLGGELALIKIEEGIPQEKLRRLQRILSETYDYIGVYSHELEGFLIIPAGKKIPRDSAQYRERPKYKVGELIPMPKKGIIKIL